jgi:hypothetical protein
MLSSTVAVSFHIPTKCVYLEVPISPPTVPVFAGVGVHAWCVCVCVCVCVYLYFLTAGNTSKLLCGLYP